MAWAFGSPSSWSELCVRDPSARSKEAGVNVFLFRRMAAVGVAWQAMKEVKAGEEDETALPKEKI